MLDIDDAVFRLRQDGDGHLRIDEYEHSIGLVYFRAGYSPDHYFTEREWEARLLIETSTGKFMQWINRRTEVAILRKRRLAVLLGTIVHQTWKERVDASEGMIAEAGDATAARYVVVVALSYDVKGSSAEAVATTMRRFAVDQGVGTKNYLSVKR